jgi:hypothetical protein
MNLTAKRSVNMRLLASVVLFTLCAALAVPVQSLQDEEPDRTRRLWNLQFRKARAAKSAPGPEKIKPSVDPTQDTSKAEKRPAAPTPGALADPVGTIEGELIGVTFWRLRSATVEDKQDRKRLLLQQVSDQNSSFLPERVSADMRFKEGSLVRLSIEAPRQTRSYLYVFDHEVYNDGTTSDTYQIFPSQTTPPGGNVVEPGKVIFVPAQGDPIPWFTLKRTEGARILVSEMLTIIVSPEPLPANLVIPVRLAADLTLPKLNKPMKELEEDYGGPTEKREASKGDGNLWTVAEKEAGEGKRLLLQQDPLPQTIYLVRVKPGAPFLVRLPLLLAQ